MFRLALPIILAVFLIPSPSNAQQAEAPVYKDVIGGASKWMSVVPPASLFHKGLNSSRSTSSNSSRVIRLSWASEETKLNKSAEHWSLRWFLARVNFVEICCDFLCAWASVGRDESIFNHRACKCVGQNPIRGPSLGKAKDSQGGI